MTQNPALWRRYWTWWHRQPFLIKLLCPSGIGICTGLGISLAIEQLPRWLQVVAWSVVVLVIGGVLLKVFLDLSREAKEMRFKIETALLNIEFNQRRHDE